MTSKLNQKILQGIERKKAHWQKVVNDSSLLDDLSFLFLVTSTVYHFHFFSKTMLF